MAAAGPLIGIDLGTTFSAIAFLNAYGRAEIIPTREGSPSLPSVVLFPPRERGQPEEVLVGLPAKRRSHEFPERVVEFVKREMGDPDWVFALEQWPVNELERHIVQCLIRPV